MYIRSPDLHGVLEDRLQHLDDGSLALVSIETEVGEIKLTVRQLFIQLLGEIGNLVGAAVNQIQRIEQLRLTHYRLLDGLLQDSLQLIIGKDIHRIGHAYQKAFRLFG